jgi:hypothetical protein
MIGRFSATFAMNVGFLFIVEVRLSLHMIVPKQVVIGLAHPVTGTGHLFGQCDVHAGTDALSVYCVFGKLQL